MERLGKSICLFFCEVQIDKCVNIKTIRTVYNNETNNNQERLKKAMKKKMLGTNVEIILMNI